MSTGYARFAPLQWAIGSVHDIKQVTRLRRLGLHRSRHRSSALAAARLPDPRRLSRASSSPTPLKTAGDVGQITLMRANLRMPDPVARAIHGSRRRDQRRRHPLPARPPALSPRSMSTARAPSPRRRARPACTRLVHHLGHRRRQPQLARTAISSPRSRPKTRSSRASQRHHPAAQRRLRPEDALFNRLARLAGQAPFMPAHRRRPRQGAAGLRGDVGRRRRRRRWRGPTRAKTVFELGGPRVYSLSRARRRSPCARSTATSRIVGVPGGR